MDINEFKKTYEVKKVVENNNQVPPNPLVSVCVQTYQHVNYIKECLDGILNQQTDFDFEILLGEDASNDGTREICIDYAERYPDKIRLFLHHRENNIKLGGQPTGRFNFLYNLYLAQGKYIALCEGDDYWTDPLKLQNQVDFLEANPGYSMCFHEVEVKDETNNIFKGPYSLIDKDILTTEDFFGRHIVGTCSILYKSNDFVNENSVPNIASGDKWLIFKLSLLGKIRFLNETMGVYRNHTGGVSRTHNGIKKVYDMAWLLHNFNILADYKFTEKCHESLLHEINVHICKTHISKKTINDLKFNELVSEIINRIVKRFKKFIT